MSRPWSHQRTYPLLGIVLAIGAPLGFVALRSVLAGRLQTRMRATGVFAGHQEALESHP